MSYTTSDRKEEPKRGNLSEALSEQRQVLRQPHVTDQFVDEVLEEQSAKSREFGERADSKLEDQGPKSNVGKIELVAMIAPETASWKQYGPSSYNVESSNKTKPRFVERPSTSQPFSNVRKTELGKEMAKTKTPRNLSIKVSLKSATKSYEDNLTIHRSNT